MVLAINQDVKFVKTKTHQFESSSTKRIYFIRPQSFHCVSKNVVYLFTCKTCHKQYTGGTKNFWSRFNNRRCAHTKFLRSKKVKEESFHAYFEKDLHEREGDWEIRWIDQVVSVDDLRQRESYWQQELDTFQTNELNEREVTPF